MTSGRLGRAALAAAVVIPLAALGAGRAAAQAPAAPPVVTIAAGASSTPTITGADALTPGPTTLTLTTSVAREHDLSVVRLSAGRTVAQLRRYAATLKAEAPPTRIGRYGALLFGGTPTRAHPYSATVVLTQGTYVVIDDTKKAEVVGQFAVGAGSNGVTAPAPVATVTLSDYGFGVTGAIPRTGVVRFTNAGHTLHFALLVKAASPAAARHLARLLHQGHDRQAEAMAKGFDQVLGLVSPGVSNDVTLSGLAPGSYVLACFYGDAHSHGKEHTMLGMEKVVTIS
jgi:hypothetical protein